MADTLPTVSELLSQNDAQIPTVSELLKQHEDSGVMSNIGAGIDTTAKAAAGAAVDFLGGGDWHHDVKEEFWSRTAAGRIATRFGYSVKHETLGMGKLGLSKETEDELRKIGVFNDFEKEHNSFLKDFNEAMIKPAVVGFDATMRAMSGIVVGGSSAIAQAGEEIGLQPVSDQQVKDTVNALSFAVPELGVAMSMGARTPKRVDAAAATETAAAETVAAKAATPEPVITNPEAFVAEARANGVIGEGEDVYMGIKDPTPEQLAQREAALAELQAASAPIEPVKPMTVHDLAREVNPALFENYDSLKTKQETMRQWMDDLGAKRTESIDAEIAAIKEAKKGGYGKLQKLEAQRAEILAAGDSPDMEMVRSKLQEVDQQLRDMAGDVSAAYRLADERMPKAELIAAIEDIPAKIETKAKAVDVVPEVKPVEVKQPELIIPAPQPVKISIIDDVARKLVSAGRPMEEARAAATLVEAHYRAITEQGWVKGTAEEVYAREGANIKASKSRARARVLAQNEKELNQSSNGNIKFIADGMKPTIALMQRADASTFMHEMGHQWLEDMARYSKNADAPDTLLKDMKTVRDWLGAPEGEFTTKQHEKFARGFERYLMEGVAPSIELAGIFAKFRQWLTTIYQTVAALKSPITEDIRGVFDRMLSAKPERVVIASERELPKKFADIHEDDVKSLKPENAAPVRDNIHDERLKITLEKVPEDYDGIVRGSTDETARRAATNPQPTSNGFATEPTGRKADDLQGAGAVSEGRVGSGETGGASRGAATEKVKKSVYEKVPREPMRLADFVRKNGGIKDNLGDVRQFVDNKRSNILRKNSGKYLDDMTLIAWENGYFPEHGNNRPDINAFLDKLKEDINGKPQYSDKDIDKVMAFNDAMSRNEEIDRLAERYGIDAKGKNSTEFWADVANAMTEEQRLAEEKSQYEAHLADMDEAEKAAKDWIESRGDAWEPDVFYEEKSQPVTLEDLERAREQEKAAAQQGKSKGSADVPGFAPEDTGEVQGSGGQGGSGTSATGDRQKPPERSTDIFGRAETRLVDKAGNIRIDLLGTPEDVSQVIRDTAAENNDFIGARRGVLSDAAVSQLAYDLGMQPSDLSARKIGQAFNAEQVVAARRLLVESANSVRDAMAKAAHGTDEDLLAYAEAKSRHQMIQEQVSGITAEAGRALRAFRDLEGAKEAKALGDFLKDTTGKTLHQLREEAQLGLSLDTPQKLSKFIHESRKATKMDMVVEAWISGLLSGPKTFMVNNLSNMITTLYSVPETAVAGVVGKVLGSTEGVALSEAKARAFGIVQSSKEAVRVAWEALKNEDVLEDTAKLEYKRMRAIPNAKVTIGGKEFEVGGKQIRLPMRLLGASDAFFKTIARRSELNAMAYRTAEAEKLTGRDFAARVHELMASPPADMLDKAEQYAKYQTFNKDLGATGQSVQRLVNSHPAMKFVVPFIRTPTNIVKYAGERTPFGLFSREVRDNIAGKNGQVARDTQIARVTLGTAIGVATASLVAQGLITGGGPSESNKRALLQSSGWQPYSIKIGENYYAYNRIDPFGMIMGVTADMVEVGQKIDEVSVNKVAALVTGSIVKNITSKTWLRGPSELIEAIDDWDRYGENYIKGLVGTVIPTGAAQIAQAQDPYLREARSIIDNLKARTPGLSQSLMPKRDIWGEPIARDGGLGPDIISPIYESRIKDDPVTKKLISVGVYPSKVERKINGVELTDEQYDEYAEKSGKMLRMRLEPIIRSGAIDSLPKVKQAEILKRTTEQTRDMVRDLMMMKHPEIIKKSLDNKLKDMRPGQ